MTPLAVRRLSRRFGNRGGVLLVVLAVSAALALHHSVVCAGDMHHGADMGAAIALCLGVMAAGAAAVAVAIAVLALGRRRPLRIVAALGLAVAFGSSVPRVRAGPTLLSLICVLRR